MKRKLAAEIIKASKAVRKKQLALRMGRAEEENLLERHFKPITEPLQKILKTEAIKQEIKPELPSPPKQDVTTPQKKYFVSTSTSPIKPTEGVRQEETQFEYNPLTEEEEQEITTEKSFHQFREEYQKLLDQDPQSVDEFLEQYERLPRVYIDGLLGDTKGDYDLTFGPHYDPVLAKLKLGNAILGIDGVDIVVDEVRYKGTAGLYELIFKTHPVGFTKDDENRYRDILFRTHVHHRENNPKKHVKSSVGYKYMNIVRPLIHKPHAATASEETLRPRAATVSSVTLRPRPSVRGGTIGERMEFSDTPYQYVYWNDLNEIVGRLKLLYASQQAGHSGHANEIASIIEELREAGVIEDEH